MKRKIPRWLVRSLAGALCALVLILAPTYPTLVASMGALEGRSDPMRFEWELHPLLQVLGEGFSHQVPASDLFLRFERSPLWLLTYCLLLVFVIQLGGRITRK